MISVIPRKKVLILRHSEFRGRANSEARNETERNGIPRIYGTRTTRLYDYSDIEPGSNWRPHPCKGCMITTTLRNSKMISLYLFHGMVRNGIPTVTSIFFPRNGIPRCFLFRLRIRKGILRVCFYFCIHGKEFRVVFSSAEVFRREFREFASFLCSTERNSELFSLPRKGSERNCEVFCSSEQPEFRRK
jgi:hypothetical protein